MNKKIFIFISAILITFFFPGKIFAADLEVSCSSISTCVITGANPLFSLVSDGYWYPGRTIAKTINIKNTGGNDMQIVLRGVETSASNNLKQVVDINITTSDNTVIWSGKLSEFYSHGSIALGLFNSGAGKNYRFTASMDVNATNDYQDLESVFDLILGFLGEQENYSSSISGFKYYDLNMNNKWDGWFRGEYKINGWMIFIDRNNNAKFDWGERFTFTNGWFFYLPEGKYFFNKLNSGTYNICESQLSNWESSLKNHAVCQKITVESGQSISNVNFGNRIIIKR
jgi:hypothetical protein